MGGIDDRDTEYRSLRVAPLHHGLVFDALQRHHCAPAEMLPREHAWIGLRFGRPCRRCRAPNASSDRPTGTHARSPPRVQAFARGCRAPAKDRKVSMVN
jgi:hypothetical protein